MDEGYSDGWMKSLPDQSLMPMRNLTNHPSLFPMALAETSTTPEPCFTLRNQAEATQFVFCQGPRGLYCQGYEFTLFFKCVESFWYVAREVMLSGGRSFRRQKMSRVVRQG